MAADKKPGRNDPCHCGSGKKYKSCCLAKDEAAERAARAKAAETAAAEAAKEPAAPPPPPPKPTSYQPWRRGSTDTRGFQRLQIPRRSGGS